MKKIFQITVMIIAFVFFILVIVFVVNAFYKDNDKIIEPDSVIVNSYKEPVSKAEFSSSSSSSSSSISTSTIAVIDSLPKIIKLDVPYYQQEYEKSCEAASLRMVLEYYGIKTNDWDILQAIGYNPRGRDLTKNIWDDPAEMFVGYVEKGKSGYGAYAEPVVKASESFGREANAYKNISARFLAEHISNGHPVIAWGYYPQTTFVKYAWKTEEGKDIFGYRGEHVRVVYGFDGETDNPKGFYVHDPNFANGGADQYWDAEKLIKNMNTAGELSNQAVVVI